MSTTIENTQTMTEEQAEAIIESDELQMQQEEEAVDMCVAQAEAEGEPETTPESTEANETTQNTPKAETRPAGVPDADTWHEIEQARSDERRAEEAVAELSDELKAAKKRLDGASQRLGELIDRANEPWLWNQPADNPAPSPIVESDQPIAEPEPEAWKSVFLNSLEPAIKPRVLTALAEHEPSIQTLGDLTDWQSLKGDWWADDIKGLGAAGVQQIEEAAAAYWAANPLPADGDKPTPSLDESDVDPDGGLPITDAADVGLEDFDFEAALRDDLLPKMRMHRQPTVERWAEINEDPYVVIGKPQNGVYQLKRIAEVDLLQNIDTSGKHFDEYVGGVIKIGDAFWQFQAAGLDLYVRAVATGTKETFEEK